MGLKTVTVICAISHIWKPKTGLSVEYTKGEPNGTCVTHSPDEKYKRGW